MRSGHTRSAIRFYLLGSRWERFHKRCSLRPISIEAFYFKQKDHPNKLYRVNKKLLRREIALTLKPQTGGPSSFEETSTENKKAKFDSVEITSCEYTKTIIHLRLS